MAERKGATEELVIEPDWIDEVVIFVKPPAVFDLLYLISRETDEQLISRVNDDWLISKEVL